MRRMPLGTCPRGTAQAAPRELTPVPASRPVSARAVEGTTRPFGIKAFNQPERARGVCARRGSSGRQEQRAAGLAGYVIPGQCRLAYLILARLSAACSQGRRRTRHPGIPGGNAALSTSSTAVSIIRTMITEDLCTYTILYFHQEKCFRDHEATRSPPRVHAGSGGRWAALPGGARSRCLP